MHEACSTGHMLLVQSMPVQAWGVRGTGDNAFLPYQITEYPEEGFLSGDCFLMNGMDLTPESGDEPEC